MDLSNANGIEIIGAGMTAFSAAFESIHLGISPERIRIREKDLIGGRVQTILHAGRPFDRCARWFHGGPDNVVYQYCAENLQPEIRAEFSVQNFSDALIHETFQNYWVMRDNGLIERDSRFRTAGRELTRILVREFQEKNPGQDIALAEFIARAPEHQREPVSQYVRLAGPLWLGADPRVISTTEVFGPDGSFDDANGLGRTIDYVVKSGLGRISNIMAKKLISLGVCIETGYDLKAVHKDGDGFVSEYEHDGKIETSFSKAVNLTVPLPILQSRTIKLDVEIQQALDPELVGCRSGNFSKILVALAPGSLQDRDIGEQQRVYSFGSRAGTFFALFDRYSDSIILFGSDLSRTDLGFDGKDPKQVRELISSITNAFSELRGLDSCIIADPLLINPEEIPSLRGAYSIMNIGHDRLGRNFEYNHLAIGGEWRASDAKNAGTIEGAWWSGLRLGKFNAGIILGLT